MGSLASNVALLTENRAKILRYAFIFQFIAAMPFLWFAHATGRQHAHLVLKGARTAGTVVTSVPIHVSNSTSYEAVVSFSSGADQFRFQEWKSERIAPTLGAKVTVLFDPADPDIAMVDRGYLNYLPWAPCAVIGLLLAFVASKGMLTLFFSKEPLPWPNDRSQHP